MRRPIATISTRKVCFGPTQGNKRTQLGRLMSRGKGRTDGLSMDNFESWVDVGEGGEEDDLVF